MPTPHPVAGMHAMEWIRASQGHIIEDLDDGRIMLPVADERVRAVGTDNYIIHGVTPLGQWSGS